jgi:hypothetical protein
VVTMYARVNIIFGAAGKVGAGVAHIEKSDREAVEAAAGNRGLTTLVDRRTGVIVAISYWDDLRLSSQTELTKARAGAAEAAEGALVTEGFEVAVAERPVLPDPGAAVQMTRVQLDPVRVDSGLAYVRDELLQRLSACSGLCSAELLIDRVIGNGLLVTMWRNQEAAGRAQAVLDGLRRDAEAAAGATFPRSESYMLVWQSAPAD